MCGKARSAKPREDNIFISKCISWKNLLLHKVNLVWKVITAHNISRVSLIFFNRKKKAILDFTLRFTFPKLLHFSLLKGGEMWQKRQILSNLKFQPPPPRPSPPRGRERDKASFKRLGPRDSSLSSYWALCNYVPEGIHRTDLKDQDTLICYI